nr:FAD-dependent oxidoreductase [Microbacterium bovistercoris]
MPRVVVVGASVAGVKLAQSLRSEGFTGSITLIDLEDEPLYDRPPLSKKYLSGVESAAEIALATPAELRRLGIDTRFGIVATGVDPAAKVVHLAHGGEVPYDSLVIATGARARRTPWASFPGVHVLRTRTDADALRKELVPGRHLAVIGAGFIGAEAAATARQAGMRVTIIEPIGAPMGRAMNAEVGGIFADKYRQEGVELQFGISVEDVSAVDGHLRLALTDGTRLDADAVLLGIGAVVNTEWLESSGLSLNNGVVCDATMAAVGVRDIYAIGDVARYTNDRHPESVRLEHWTSAVDQGLLVAHNLTHPDDRRRYDPTEYVWSDQYDWKIQIVGRTGSEDWTIVGDPAAGRFAIAYGIPDQTLEGAVIVNWPRALIDARRSVAGGAATGELLGRLRAQIETPKVVR